MKHKVPFILPLCTGLLLLTNALFAQHEAASSYFREGEQLRQSYDFASAKEAYTRARDTAQDSTLITLAHQRIILCENGLSLSQYITKPTVTGRFTAPLETFYLYYDLCPSGQWALPPQSLLSLLNDKGDTPRPLFYRPDWPVLVFSACDSLRQSGWDLYSVTRASSDSTGGMTWNAPTRLPGYINSSGNEIWPTLSSDGTTLWFCSDGQYGFGGYNVYRCLWDETLQSWGAPENLGIPFSSPSDDFLFMVSDNQQYLYLASQRDLADSMSVTIYRMDYESHPVKTVPAHVQEMRHVAALEDNATAGVSQVRSSTTPAATQADAAQSPRVRELIAQYQEVVSALQLLEGRLEAREQALSQQRQMYASLSREEDRVAVARTIEREELALLLVQDSLMTAQTQVGRVEEQFIALGQLPPVLEQQPQEAAPQTPKSAFQPQLQALTSLQTHHFTAPIPEVPPINLTFRIESEAQIVDWDNEDKSLYYKIQLFTLTKKSTLKQLKGLCPVYEVKVGSRYVYYTGHFTQYAQAAKALSTVRGRGFSSALVVAYYEGKSLPVSTARKQEAAGKTAPSSGSVRIFLAADQMPAGLAQEAAKITTKDIVRLEADGSVSYFIGPFASASEAENIVNRLRAAGFTEVRIENVP